MNVDEAFKEAFLLMNIQYRELIVACTRKEGRVLGAGLLGLFILSLIVTGYGQVESGSIKGVVVDRFGSSVSTASVKLKRVGPTEGDKAREIVTDKNGAFFIAGLNKGEYLLTVRFPILGPDFEKIVVVNPGAQSEIRIELGKGCSSASDELGELRNISVSKREVVRLAFAEALKRLVAPMELRKGLVVSSENIEKDWILGVVDAKTTILNKKQLQARADRKSDFRYVSFPRIEVIGTCISVSVDYSWTLSRNSKVIHMDGGGITYEFRQQDHQWIARYVSSWIS